MPNSSASLQTPNGILALSSLNALKVTGDGIIMTGLPTSEPSEVGGIWDSGGTLKIGRYRHYRY